MHHPDQKGVVQLITDGYFVLHGINLVPVVVFLLTAAAGLLHELDGVELPVLQAASQVHLAEPSDRQTVVNLVLEGVLLSTILEEGGKELGPKYFPLIEAEAIVEVDVLIN